MKFCVLTSPNQWFISYAQKFSSENNIDLFFKHEDVTPDFDVVFILSYHRIITKEFLNKHKHNIVVHAADLPQGKGWAPIAWQILEGKNEIVFTLFEADEHDNENYPAFFYKDNHKYIIKIYDGDQLFVYIGQLLVLSSLIN